MPALTTFRGDSRLVLLHAASDGELFVPGRFSCCLGRSATNAKNDGIPCYPIEQMHAPSKLVPSGALRQLASGLVPTDRPRTEQEAKAVLLASGTTVAAWARERGFSVPLARMVLAGKRKCLRGQSLEIAIALGIKLGTSAHSTAG